MHYNKKTTPTTSISCLVLSYFLKFEFTPGNVMPSKFKNFMKNF